MASKQIVFGPWIGELGWELTSWQGWVRKLCDTEYKDWDKYVVGFPGRDCLYQDIDMKYISIPEWFCNINYSARAFATDYWTKEGPVIKRARPLNFTMAPKADQLIKELKKQLPDVDKWIIPWEKMKYNGVDIGGVYSNRYVPQLIPYNEQRVIPVKPNNLHVDALHSIMNSQGFDSESQLVSLYPRARIRNADKNWPESYYIEICDLLRSTGLVTAFVGSPDGALFSNGVPDGALDLINIDQFNMLNVHIAAMSQSVLGVGPASGILHIAAFAQLPFITALDAKQYKKLRTRFNSLHNPFACKMLLIKGTPNTDILKHEVRRMCGV